MTPAIKLLEQNKVWYQLHAFDQGGSSDGYGDEAIEKLNVDPESIYKTLVTMNNDGSFFVAVLPVVTQLNLKVMAKAVGEKRIFMAPVDKSELVTGYVVGGISALGQKTKLPTVVDSSVQLRETLLISAGKRGHDIELRVTDLLALTNAKVADISIGKAST